MSDSEEMVKRWKRTDARILNNMAFAGYSFMMMGLGGLIALTYPFWFPALHFMVCK